MELNPHALKIQGSSVKEVLNLLEEIGYDAFCFYRHKIYPLDSHYVTIGTFSLAAYITIEENRNV
jgi:hypothetical protein